MEEDVLVRYEEFSFSATKTVEITKDGEITVRRDSYNRSHSPADTNRHDPINQEGELPEEEVEDLNLLLEQVSEDDGHNLSFFGEIAASFRYGREAHLDTPYTDDSVKWYEDDGVLAATEQEIERLAEEYTESGPVV